MAGRETEDMDYLTQVSAALGRCIETNHSLGDAIAEVFNDETLLQDDEWLDKFIMLSAEAKVSAYRLAELGPVPEGMDGLHSLAVQVSGYYVKSIDGKLEWSRDGDLTHLESSAAYMKQATDLLYKMLSEAARL